MTRITGSQIDMAHLMSRLKLQGAIDGSIVVLNVRPTETVRVGDIAQQKRPRDKVSLWAENSKREITETVLLKADELEKEAETSGVVGHGSRIRIDRIILRGAIGLWKKSGLDEIDLDFEKIAPGLVSLIGQNGAGKTTLIENMHPWPQLHTRDGTLKEHFRLRDSFRDLYWTDELTGAQYRAQILINAATASGSTEYFLYQKDSSGAWQPLPGITGRKDDYVSAVNKLFGSMELFLRSAFVTQRQPKNLPDLAESTAGERKALFSSLCGLEYLEAYKDLAKAKAATIESTVATKTAEANVLTARLPDRTILIETIAHALSQIEEIKGDLNVLTVLQEKKASVVSELTKQQDEQIRIISEGQKTRVDADQLRNIIAGFESQILGLEEKLAQKSDAEREVKDYAALSAALEVETKKYQTYLEAVKAEQDRVNQFRVEHDKKVAADRSVYQARLAEFEKTVKAAEVVERVAEKELDGARHVIMILEEGIKRDEAEASKPIKENCDTCGQLLPEDSRVKIRADLDAKKAKVEAKKVELHGLKETLSELVSRHEQAVKALIDIEETKPILEESLFIPPPSLIGPFDGSETSRIKGLMAFTDPEGARIVIEEASRASGMIEGLKINIASSKAKLSALEAQLNELRSKLNPQVAIDLEAAKVEHITVQKRLHDSGLELVRFETEHASLTRELYKLDEDTAQIKAIETDIKTLQTEAAEWRLLEIAFGDKGIQALELDAIAPSISAIANGLLRDAFGSRYQINFQTTRLSGSGKAQKQIEDFLIEVLDSETGDTQEIRTLSGGESVWIKRALYDAFGIVRARNTNLVFLTAFQDEADGALDPESKVTYLRMLEAAHKQSGRRHTILISHSPEIQEMIQTKIEIAKLTGRKESGVAA